MSVAEMAAGTAHGAARGGPDEISRRLESLPASSYVWRLVILLSLGGWFEIYDLFFTGYIAPGLNRSGLLTTTTQAFFGFSGIGAFVAATFAGLFVGTFFLGFLADRFGRRSIFTFALLAYSAASVIIAFQTTSGGLLSWWTLCASNRVADSIHPACLSRGMVPPLIPWRTLSAYPGGTFLA